MEKQNHNIAERKGVDEKLRESEVIYHSLFEEFRDALYITTREGKFLDVNQSMSEFFGYTKDELIGLNALELYVMSGDRTRFQQAIEQTGSVRDYEVKLRHKNGTEMDCLLTSTVRKANDGSILGYQGVIREFPERKRGEEELSIGEWMSAREWMTELTDYISEVPERKRGEEELSIGEWMSAREWMTKLTDYTEHLERLVEERTLELSESEKRYRGLYESSIDGIITTDMKGNILECNQALADMHSYSKEELYKLSIWDLMPTKWHSLTEKVIREQIIPRGYSDVLEIEAFKKDGTVFPASVRIWLLKAEDKDTVMWSIVRDITERKKLESQLKNYTENLEELVEERTLELKESEFRYSSLFEDSRDAIYITTRDGKYVDVNQAMLELFGYTRDELMNLNVMELYAHPTDRVKFQQEIEQKGSVRDYEVQLRKKDGTEIDCLLTSTVWWADDGNILGYQGIIRDITQQKREEKKTKRYTKDLERIVDEKTGDLKEIQRLLYNIYYKI